MQCSAVGFCENHIDNTFGGVGVTAGHSQGLLSFSCCPAREQGGDRAGTAELSSPSRVPGIFHLVLLRNKAGQSWPGVVITDQDSGEQSQCASFCLYCLLS